MMNEEEFQERYTIHANRFRAESYSAMIFLGIATIIRMLADGKNPRTCALADVLDERGNELTQAEDQMRRSNEKA